MTPDSQENTLPLVPEGIAIGAGGAGPVLIGGHCPECRRDFFPRPRYCPQCLQPTEKRELGGDGAVYSYTVVRVRPPFGLPQPYAVGYIDLAESGLRVFGLLNPAHIERLAIGTPVKLDIGPMGSDAGGGPCLRPYFSLAAKEGEDA